MTTSRDLAARYDELVTEETDLFKGNLDIITQAEARKGVAFRKAALLDELFEYLRRDQLINHLTEEVDRVLSERAQRTRLADVAGMATSVLRGFQ